jgi:hypothetical protein
MLLPACLALVGFVIGVVVVARVSARVIAALGLELFPTLVWLGLADWPNGQSRKQRPRLVEMLAGAEHLVKGSSRPAS